MLVDKGQKQLVLHKEVEHGRPRQSPSTTTITPSTSQESFPSATDPNEEDAETARAVPQAVLTAATKVQKGLEKFPRILFGHLPTPLEYCPRLSEALGGVQIYVKRDDCTGLANGGNKTRKLEWLMADAVESKAEYVMTHGATQSNHVRQTCAAAAKLGLKCHVLLEDRTRSSDPNYHQNGNVLLDDLFGATRETRPSGLDMQAEMEAVAEQYRKVKGAEVYAIHGGGSNPIGAVGYVNCACEMIRQFDEQGIDADHLVFATGSAGTHAGLATGLKACGSSVRLLGFGVRKPRPAQEEAVLRLAERVSARIGLPGIVEANDVEADCDYVGEGYGVPGADTIEAIRMFAQLEGLLLDPVYSGKAAAGLIDYCRKGRFAKGEKVVFLHTGGQTALHGYINSFHP